MSELKISQATFTAIDFESAGALPGETDVPIQVGIAQMGPELQINEASFFRSYIAPGREVSWAASKVHGITTEDLTDAPQLFSLWPELKQRLAGKIVVAHSAATEKRFLRAFPMHGFGPWVDTLRIARAAFPESQDHSLGNLVAQTDLDQEMTQLCPDLKWHDALYDAVASLVLLRHIIIETGSEDASTDLLLRPDLESYYRERRK